jgi:pimeloyl-ACP methyl ester carboxylesterase
VRLVAVPMPVTAPAARPVAVSTTRFEQHDVEVLGARVRYIDVGPTDQTTAADTIVILPGHTARIEGYDAIVPALAAAHRVLVLDLPGSGYADKPDRAYTLAYYEEFIAAFLDELGVTTAVPVGGSLGGNLVLRVGHRWPERFPRLVAWAPGGAWKARPLTAGIVRRIGGRVLFWPTVWVQSRFWYRRDFPGRRSSLEETFAYYREIMGRGFIRMYWGIVADLLRTSLFDIAGEICQPVLLLWGDQDNGGGMRAGVARIDELLPNGELVVFPGARHSVETEIPDALAAAITAWLARP